MCLMVVCSVVFYVLCVCFCVFVCVSCVAYVFRVVLCVVFLCVELLFIVPVLMCCAYVFFGFDCSPPVLVARVLVSVFVFVCMLCL